MFCLARDFDDSLDGVELTAAERSSAMRELARAVDDDCPVGEIAGRLIALGAAIDGSGKESPLLLACTKNLELARILVEGGAQVNAVVGDDGGTLLHRLRRPEPVALLLDAGADPNIPDATGATPLHAAVKKGERQFDACVYVRVWLCVCAHACVAMPLRV